MISVSVNQLVTFSEIDLGATVGCDASKLTVIGSLVADDKFFSNGAWLFLKDKVYELEDLVAATAPVLGVTVAAVTMALFVVAVAAIVKDVVVLISTEVVAVAAAAVWFFPQTVHFKLSSCTACCVPPTSCTFD